MWLRLGDLPTWFAAGGTVGALWFTAITFRHEQTDRAASDARFVAAWIGTEEVEEVGFEMVLPGTYPAVVMRNGSPEPVYDVDIRWSIAGDACDPIRRDVIPPSGEDSQIVNASKARVDSITFRDTAGRVWTRDRLGRLKQTAGP